MDKDLREAYKTTLDDLEIALRNCGLFEFKARREYTELIKEYEYKLYCL